MGLIDRLTKYDNCVYWAPTRKNQFGKQLFAEPVELGCRWEDTITVQRSLEAEELLFDVKVYVSTDVEEDGMLWHGKLNDVPVGEGGPLVPPVDAVLIRKFTKVGNLRNTKYVRTAFA